MADGRERYDDRGCHRRENGPPVDNWADSPGYPQRARFAASPVVSSLQTAGVRIDVSVTTGHGLRDVGITDRKLCDYVASLLEAFSRASGLRAPHMTAEKERQYVSDMLIALTRATAEQAFLLRAHVGNYSLFLSGIFHENTQRRSLRGAPDLAFYEQVGRTNYQLVASHATARRCDLSDVYEGLAGRFHEVRLALNRLSDSLLNLDEEPSPSLFL